MVLNIKNGTNQDFITTNYNDCWTLGNNLTSICLDESEAAAVQEHLANCGSGIVPPLSSNSDCSLSGPEFTGGSIALFPNPARDKLNIWTEDMVKTLSLYDAQGRRLLEKQVNTDSILLDVSGYPEGFYTVEMVMENGVVRRKWVKG